MIESAHRLLSGEQPSAGEQAEVANAHRTTVAQQVRLETLRLLVSDELSAELAKIPLATPIEFKLEEHLYAGHWLARPKRLGPDGSALWSEVSSVDRPIARTGFAIRLPDEAPEPVSQSYETIRSIVETLKNDALNEILSASTAEVPFLFVYRGKCRLLSLIAGTGERVVLAYTTILLPPPQQRLGEEHELLRERSVAIVGCGSIGSKIATSLARAGVRKFVLVDGDILFPGNLVRNDLDGRAVGLNKPDGVAARIAEIEPTAIITKRRLLLGGQESSASTESALESIGTCDLVVDATADPQIFNLCAAVTRRREKPLIWGEVFGGGIGGLIARLRPRIDPTPHLARTQIATWCNEHQIPWDGSTSSDYDVTKDNAPPLIADDADVSVIAAHMARLAIDVLVRQDSIFPQSAYAIGLRADWIFAAPFDTWPIELRPEGDWGPTKEADHEAQLSSLLAELFPGASGSTNAG
jgi:molybdopterin/thiamine biosynthesis adenylyltransferase